LPGKLKKSLGEKKVGSVIWQGGKKGKSTIAAGKKTLCSQKRRKEEKNLTLHQSEFKGRIFPGVRTVRTGEAA